MGRHWNRSYMKRSYVDARAIHVEVCLDPPPRLGDGNMRAQYELAEFSKIGGRVCYTTDC